MKRREFIGLLGGAAALPLAARAQPVPVIGFFSARALASDAHLVDAFRSGLKGTGYVEGQNVAIEFRWAEGRSERVAGFVADFVRRQVAVIFAGGGDNEVKAVKAAIGGIPMVFAIGGDPVEYGFVASFNRPGGNATGVTVITASLWPKRLELLRELAPGATATGLIVNPTHPSAAATVQEVQAAGHARGEKIIVLNVEAERQFEPTFASLVQQGVGGLLVMNAPLFFSRRQQLVALAARHNMPTIYDRREFTAAGGLMSYGASTPDQYRQCGVYAGRILQGEKPAILPVMQPTKFEMVINMKTAKALGIKVPLTLQVAADEVIE
jgi:putative tryptophan/tyrosine transport system substrate-binding protein